MRLCIEASTTNPSQRQSHSETMENIPATTTTSDRALAIRRVQKYLSRGCWVEVYNDASHELLAGPFDPDEPIPRFII
jgi:hypothetical protein